jgi:hypothetical protein
MTKHEADQPGAQRILCASEIAQVSGGEVLEKENLYPRKPIQTEVAVYVDGHHMGTAHVNPGDPSGPFNPPWPLNR